MLPAALNNPKLLFFTGGNALMPNDIYSDFIQKLKIHYNVDIIKNSFSKEGTIIEQLLEHSAENEIVPIGHSSGCTTLLNYCSKLKNIKKCILLDPVNNNLKNNLDIKINNILQINAEKSYKWKYKSGMELIRNPIPKIPFIPAFNMDINNFGTNNLTKIEIKDYGHCDILDTAFSNIMHNSVAEGNEDRNSLNNYRQLLVELIYNYIISGDINDDLINDHKSRFNIEYTKI